MKRPALQNKQVVVLQLAFRARKVLGTFEKRAPEVSEGQLNRMITMQSFVFGVKLKERPL